jgi:LysR family transcriptional regulator, hydrogen peroxide-inducible genes activator
MNLQQLRYVRALAELGSFVEAAKQCGVTQPTLSNGVAALEEELGLRLFVRTTRNVELSEFGRHLLPSIADLLNAQTALLARARELAHPKQRIVRIGVSPLVGIELVSLMFEPFRRTNPNLEIIFREMNLAEMTRLLAIGQLEFVIGPVDHDVRRRAAWCSVQFHEEPLVFVAKGKSESRSRRAEPVTLKAIATETFVMVPDACGLAKLTRSIFQRRRLKLQEYSGQAMSYRVLQEWAELGVGAAILPRSKVTSGGGSDILIRKGSDKRVMIAYEASWCNKTQEVKALGGYLSEVVPSFISGLYARNTGARSR